MVSPQALSELTVLRIAGADAESFLQGQLTHDLRLLNQDGRTLLAACCTPQGRTIALLWLRRTGDDILALTAAELAEPLLAHLLRYVLRSRVQLARLDRTTLLGCADVAATAAALATWPAAVEFRRPGGRSVLLLPPGTPQPAPTGPGDDAWRLGEIRQGLPEVRAATSGAFVPQMLNLDCLDGISFAKGCYTGQEIVARTQFLGRIKRRTLRFTLAGGPPAPGARIVDGDSPAGEVVAAAPAEHGRSELLAVVTLDQAGRELRLASDPGRGVLEPQPLPYSLQPVDPASGRM